MPTVTRRLVTQLIACSCTCATTPITHVRCLWYSQTHWIARTPDVLFRQWPLEGNMSLCCCCYVEMSSWIQDLSPAPFTHVATVNLTLPGLNVQFVATTVVYGTTNRVMKCRLLCMQILRMNIGSVVNVHLLMLVASHFMLMNWIHAMALCRKIAAQPPFHRQPPSIHSFTVARN